ncbi:hypothetical protein [Paenibacillus aceris]|uniref:Uncharacterized protein n=1 Tax=Paenibacillus aceris TaxID=869555 RepID=A0ABS4HZ75_9BACL|nr:hypothetical protein [Paenibacillus aceris]MBP1963982.1 hypothetical protein [Paenibacillus aceris]NHW34600.1 hypothetical protein [Paenibacillus aceris]
MNKKRWILIIGILILFLFGAYLYQRLDDSIVDRHGGGTISKDDYNEQFKVIEKSISVDRTFFFNLKTNFLIELQSGDLMVEIWNPKEERVFYDKATSEKTYMNEFVSKPLEGIWKVKFIINPQTEGTYQFLFRSTPASWLSGGREDWFK